MTSIQTHKLQLLIKIKAFLDKNASVFASFTRLNDEFATFNSALLSIKVTAQRQILDRKGIAVQKKKARKAMASTVTNYADLAYVWASDVKNAELQQVFDIAQRRLLNGPGSSAIDKSRNIAKAISKNIGSLAPYRILPADLAIINASIDAFSGVLVSPADARTRAYTATHSLPALFKKADTSLQLFTKLFLSQYSQSHPHLVREFKIDHRLGKPAVRHTGITAHITFPAGEDAEGVQMQIPELKKTATSDISGIAQIIRCKPGRYHVEFSYPGYITIIIKEKLIRGRILPLTIKMVKEEG
jgi:hypothetical protein